MTVATKQKSTGIKIPKNKKVTMSVEDCRQQQINRRIEEKVKLLERFSTSEELFDELRDEINTLCHDESSDDFSVSDEYSFGVDYNVELILELISDLRSFTRLTKDEDDKHITIYNLDYLRPYF